MRSDSMARPELLVSQEDIGRREASKGSLFPKRIVLGALSAVLVFATWTAWISGEWELTNLVIGFLFGFFLQRGSFCGASIFSSIILYKEFRALAAVALAILVTMVGFAGLTALDWMVPNPRPLNILPAVLGGVFFGVGMVLAGGCVSGSLYKAGEGRVNSILAVVGIVMGGSLLSAEFIAPTRVALSMYWADLQLPISIDQALEIPYSVLASMVGAMGLTIMLVLAHRRKKELPNSKPSPRRWISRRWPIAWAGALIGVLGWFAYLSFSATGRNTSLAPTRGVVMLFSLLSGEITAANLWRVGETVAIVAGSSLSAWLTGQLALRTAEPSTLLISLLGGILAGAGAVVGGGCFVANMIGGWAFLSVHSFLFVIFMILANWATTIFYLRGVRS